MSMQGTKVFSRINIPPCATNEKDSNTPRTQTLGPRSGIFFIAVIRRALGEDLTRQLSLSEEEHGGKYIGKVSVGEIGAIVYYNFLGSTPKVS